LEVERFRNRKEGRFTGGGGWRGGGVEILMARLGATYVLNKVTSKSSPIQI
jgi:hypothetical protein